MSAEKASNFRSTYKKNVKTALRDKQIPTRGPDSVHARATQGEQQS